MILVALAFGSSCRRSGSPPEPVLADVSGTPGLAVAEVLYPLPETWFPPEIVAPTFRWRESERQVNRWVLRFQFEDGQPELRFSSQAAHWQPSARDWEQIKRRTRDRAARLTLFGLAGARPARVCSQGETTFRTSKDEVGAPLFYRDVNLPFIEAVKDPRRIRWRFGSVSMNEPPVVLAGLPVCGNCHSFSRDGAVLGMDVDYANSKGSYVLTRTAKTMDLASSDIITWDDYKRDEGDLTLGLLSQVSPDGRYVISTVKDRSVFVPKPDLAFSQLFFPIKGILAVYDRQTKRFRELRGAADPQYVQSNPVWSPDGKVIVFARARSYQLRHPPARDSVLLAPGDCDEFLKEGRPFRFDLYRVPFNAGEGGTPEPVAGASQNDLSNFFPKFSPDGRWIVFCRARNYMLLQPDSELFIVPASGGTPRRLRANTGRMNSWHSWSPNGRWLVFASKANTPYTQLFLTHIDEQGESTPPVVLDHFTAHDRAANLPEFVPTRPDAIRRIREKFVDDYSLARAAYAGETTGDIDGAIRNYERALELNPRNAHAHQRLGFLFYNVKRDTARGLHHTQQALRLEPTDGCAHHDLGMALLDQGKPVPAAKHLREALRLLPRGFEGRYNPAEMQFHLGLALLMAGDPAASVEHLDAAVKLDPRQARAHHSYAFALAHTGRVEDAVAHYEEAVRLQPDLDGVAALPDLIASVYAQAGRYAEAIVYADRAVEVARKAGNEALRQQLRQRLESYRAKR
jgi:tetratricopeptide (TPR) repeat protein